MKRLLLATTIALVATPAGAVTFNYTGAIVSFVVPTTGTWEIEATGARGGGPTVIQGLTGGLGALVGGEFELSSGTVLRIAVGGMGSSELFGGGGGGGSFVVQSNNTPLIIAGGGGGVWGGASFNGHSANTGQAGLTSSGSQPFGGGAPMPIGTIGLGGAATAVTYGAGGAGFFSNGDDDVPGTGGKSWFWGIVPERMAGGVGNSTIGNGGFGGGGAGPGGGGGGYSGGQGGAVGGGGGSYNADTDTGWLLPNAGTGNGLITLTLIAEAVTTPEPASATLALLGLFGLAALRRRP